VAKAKILNVARRHDRAIEQCHEAIDLEPKFASAFSVLAQAYAFHRQYPEAIEAAKKYVEISGGTGWANLELAYAYAVAGNKADSDRIVREVTTQSKPFSPYDMATIRAAWHDTAGALRWLGRAIDQRSVDVVWIGVDPRLDNVRSDPRFREVVARMIPRG